MEEEKRKLPEFVFVEEGHHSTFKQDPFHAFKEAKPVKLPWTAHLACFVLFIPLLFWALIALLSSGVVSLINQITFKKIKAFRTLTRLYWTSTKGACVLSLAFFTGIFSPMLALIIALFYFSKAQDGWQKRTVSSVSSRYFS